MRKSVKWRTYLSANERFADVINGTCFQGEQVLKAECLEDKDTQYEPVKVDEKATNKPDYAWHKEKYRDVVKKWCNGVAYVIFGTESQEKVDYTLALRTMIYDVAEYERQRAEIARQVRQKKDNLEEELSDEEYLCGFLKTSKLYPVLTVILYSGHEPWDGPRSLHDMLDLAGLPDEIKNLVPDYRINVIELARLEDTTVFQTDLKHVIDFIKVSNDRNAVKRLVEEEPYFRKMAPETYDVVAEYANISNNTNVGVRKLGGEEMTKDLCKGLADWLDESVEQGKAEVLSENVLNMAEAGMDSQTIARILKKDIVQIEHIIAQGFEH